MQHYMFLSRPEDSKTSGPFNNEQQFIIALAKKSRTLNTTGSCSLPASGLE